MRGGQGCGRGRRVRAIRRCEPPAPQAGMSCRGSLYSPGMCLDRGQEDEGSGLPPCPRGRGFLSEARLEVPKEGGFSRRVSPSDDSNPAVPAPPARIRPAGCRSRPGDRDRGGSGAVPARRQGCCSPPPCQRLEAIASSAHLPSRDSKQPLRPSSQPSLRPSARLSALAGAARGAARSGHPPAAPLARGLPAEIRGVPPAHPRARSGAWRSPHFGQPTSESGPDPAAHRGLRLGLPPGTACALLQTRGC